MCYLFVASSKTNQAFILREMMEVQDQESLGRWDRVGSRDASSRAEAMESICQEVTRKVEAIGPIMSVPHSPPSLGSPAHSDLNDILAHILMLSKRCPFEDVRQRCIQLLKDIQVGDSHDAQWNSGELFIHLVCCQLPSSSPHLLISIVNTVV